ncbi:LysM peptidoglycan-binding domain-containing protein [Enhygromyxa salina]|uniref:LysM domain/BON superfamily protein n=1 Tax=Enhygromyxa salina TaxID=215803 RepID=A0A2S9YPW6_9BACT|nr:LysM domain-containing protein [Enhygromyxa salina]PRQ07118.1 LysM domain/BON superfamily protein [Enhygromyxa salina]
MRISSSSSVPGLVLLFAAAQLPLIGPAFAGPPAGDNPASTRGTTSVGVGGFSPPPQGEFDPSTTADPGLLDRSRSQAADQTYGATGAGDRVGYDIIDAGLYTSDDWGDGTPDFHIVEEGDTLSEICAYYYGDMYLWPKIWSYNPHITNAHWIFPGDRIRLTDPYESATGDDSGLGYAKSYNPSKGGSQTYLLERYAFIDEEEIDKAMEITGGAEPGIMMGTLDTAYIDYKPENPPIPGERLSVYRKKTPVYDIKVKGKKQKLKQGKRIGWLVEVVGEVYVRSVADKSAEAEIVDSVRPVERGQRVGELKTRFARVGPTANEVTINGLVVETIREHTINGEAQFVIINIGASDGVRRGNTLEVVQKGDAYTPDHRLHQPYEKGHPRRVYASLLVLQIEGDSALTVVTESLREIVTGDHVELIAEGETPPDFDPYDPGTRDERRSNNAAAKGSASSGDGEAEASGELRLGGG